MKLEQLTKGNKNFQNIHFPKFEREFGNLVEKGQSPEIFFIVCGHSYCGACASLYDDISDAPHLVHVNKSLELGKKAKEYTLLAVEDKNNKEKILRTMEKISIKHQLENLLTYPEVLRKVKFEELEIHGWYYKIEDGGIEFYDGESCGFKPLHNNEEEK
ncbi:MAG: hypothetical protein IE909_05825 [Campylobacterales bacterium]|nr:hypothetical protein [Campylobacterales bacterium]